MSKLEVSHAKYEKYGNIKTGVLIIVNCMDSSIGLFEKNTFALFVFSFFIFCFLVNSADIAKFASCCEFV